MFHNKRQEAGISHYAAGHKSSPKTVQGTFIIFLSVSFLCLCSSVFSLSAHSVSLIAIKGLSAVVKLFPSGP